MARSILAPADSTIGNRATRDSGVFARSEKIRADAHAQSEHSDDHQNIHTGSAADREHNRLEDLEWHRAAVPAGGIEQPAPQRAQRGVIEGIDPAALLERGPEVFSLRIDLEAQEDCPFDAG